MLTVWYFAIALGLTAEAALAARRRRVLPSRQLPYVLIVSALGLQSVVSNSVDSGAGVARTLAASWVLLGWVACVAIDMVNRRTQRSVAN